MKITARFLQTCAFGFLIATIAAGLVAAQTNGTPPLSQPQQPGPTGQAPTGPPNQLAPTGIAENGGSIANGVYTNSIYGFTLNIPPGWVVVPPPKALPENQQPETSSSPTRPQPIRLILIVTENAPLKKNYERKSLQVSVVPVTAPTRPETARDFIAFSENNAKGKGLTVEYLGTTQEITINGRQVWEAKLNETINGTVQHIEQYAVAEGKAVLQFMLVSPEAEGLKAMQPSIKSLRFRDATPDAPAKKATAQKKESSPQKE